MYKPKETEYKLTETFDDAVKFYDSLTEDFKLSDHNHGDFESTGG